MQARQGNIFQSSSWTDRVSSTSLIHAAFIKLASDNDERNKRTGKLKSLHTNRKERKKSKMPKRKRKKDDGSKSEVKYKEDWEEVQCTDLDWSQRTKPWHV